MIMNTQLFNDQELFWLEQEEASSDNELFLPSDISSHSSQYYKVKQKRCKSKYQRAQTLLIEKHINEFNEIQKKLSECIDTKSLPATTTTTTIAVTKKVNGRNNKKLFKLTAGREYLEKNYDTIKNIFKNFDEKDNNQNGDHGLNTNTQNNNTSLTYQEEITKVYNSAIRSRRIAHQKQLYNLSKQHFHEQLQIKKTQYNAFKTSKEKNMTNKSKFNLP
ncbi:unnamed protein product [Cunninghamella echinulata]